MFRYKRGVKADYNRQGYIYFTSRRYRELDEAAQQKILNLCLEHGWWDEPRSFGDIVALCHSELSEALEEYRNGKPMIYGCCGHCDKETQCEVDGKPEHSCKPEGIATEMVDCLIRILDWCGKEGVDVEAVLAQKHEYNRTRPYRHGGKAL